MTCPCGQPGILADTEDWQVPRCHDCWVALGSPAGEVVVVDCEKAETLLQSVDAAAAVENGTFLAAIHGRLEELLGLPGGEGAA